MIVGVPKRIPFALPSRVWRLLAGKAAKAEKEERRPRPPRESAMSQFERMLEHTVSLTFRNFD